MTQSSLSREATATIRGFIYQFDATIRKLLSLEQGFSITIEGIEDFDVQSKLESEYSQVKYYAAQKLTDSVLRDAILPMLTGFLQLDKNSRVGVRYVLYGHYKESVLGLRCSSLEELQRILTRTTYGPVDGEKKAVVTNIQAQLNASDDDLRAFSNCLVIRLVEEYHAHKAIVVNELRQVLGVSENEALAYSYPSALTLVSELAAHPDISTRTLTRDAFTLLIRPTTAIYNEWALREEGEAAYCSSVKKRYFSDLNIDQAERFFVLSGLNSFAISDIIDIAKWIVRKWSTYASERKPNSERYAPYLFFPDLSENTLSAIKQAFLNAGMVITDGFPFKNSAFDVVAIQEPQTKARRIAARFVEDHAQLSMVISSMRRQRDKLIVQLYIGQKEEIPIEVQHITLPINSLEMIKSIL